MSDEVREYVQGASFIVILSFFDQETGDPIDVSGASEVKVCTKVPNDITIEWTKLGGKVTNVTGFSHQVQFRVQSTESDQMVEGNITIQAEATVGLDILKNLNKEAFKIIQKEC